MKFLLLSPLDLFSCLSRPMLKLRISFLFFPFLYLDQTFCFSAGWRRAGPQLSPMSQLLHVLLLCLIFAATLWCLRGGG